MILLSTAVARFVPVDWDTSVIVV